MKNIIADVGDELDAVVAFALCGGSALYLLTYSAIRIRVLRRWQVAAVGSSRRCFSCSCSLATMVPALAALGCVTAVWVALHTYELCGGARPRAESRAAPTLGGFVAPSLPAPWTAWPSCGDDPVKSLRAALAASSLAASTKEARRHGERTRSWAAPR